MKELEKRQVPRTGSPLPTILSSPDLIHMLGPWTLSFPEPLAPGLGKASVRSPRGYHVVPTLRISTLRKVV